MVGCGITHFLSQHGEVETAYPPWGSLASQPGLFGEFQVKERPCLKKESGWHLRNDTHLRHKSMIYL